jgi:hypothetical protein
MRLWTLFMLVVGLMACAAPIEDEGGGDEGDDDDLGLESPSGSGGDGGGGGSSASTSASGSTSTSSTTGASTSSSANSTSASGGGMGACEASASDCVACQTCAMQTECAAQFGACQANAECVALNTCLNGCPPGDQACLDGCAVAHPNGEADLETAANCVFCSSCPIDCDGQSLGCF